MNKEYQIDHDYKAFLQDHIKNQGLLINFLNEKISKDEAEIERLRKTVFRQVLGKMKRE